MEGIGVSVGSGVFVGVTVGGSGVLVGVAVNGIGVLVGGIGISVTDLVGTLVTVGCGVLMAALTGTGIAVGEEVSVGSLVDLGLGTRAALRASPVESRMVLPKTHKAQIARRNVRIAPRIMSSFFFRFVIDGPLLVIKLVRILFYHTLVTSVYGVNLKKKEEEVVDSPFLFLPPNRAI